MNSNNKINWWLAAALAVICVPVGFVATGFFKNQANQEQEEKVDTVVVSTPIPQTEKDDSDSIASPIPVQEEEAKLELPPKPLPNVDPTKQEERRQQIGEQKQQAEERRLEREQKRRDEQERQKQLNEERRQQRELKRQEEQERQQKLAEERRQQRETKRQEEQERQKQLAAERQRQKELKEQQLLREKQAKEEATKQKQQEERNKQEEALKKDVQAIVSKGQSNSKVPDGCTIVVNNGKATNYLNFRNGIVLGAYSNVSVTSVESNANGTAATKIFVKAKVNRADD